MTDMSRKKLYTSLGQAHEFELAMIKQSVLRSDIQAVIGGRKEVSFSEKQNQKNILSSLNIGKVSKDELVDLSIWDIKKLYSLYYQQAYGLFVDFPDELMPEASDEFAWLACVPGIISTEASFSGGKLNPPRWKWTDKSLDAVLELNRGRDAWTHSYIVRVRPNWEADEDLRNLSGNDIERQDINAIMLRERFVLGNFLDWLTGEKLDRKTVTLSGSCYSGGNVPHADWSDDGLAVGWYPPDGAVDHLRSRRVVS